MPELRKNERGAVQIKTVVALFIIGILVFLLIKFVPVYIKRQELAHDVDELARISAVRGYKADRINKEIGEVIKRYELADNSVSLQSAEQGRVLIAVSHNFAVDLYLTTYNWQYDYTATGKDF
jgi:Flp pilus assembly protein TadG